MQSTGGVIGHDSVIVIPGVQVRGKRELPQMIDASERGSLLLRTTQCRQQHPRKDRDDCDND